MHYQKVKGLLSKDNGMNIYRGCTHGCIYCDSRSKCYNMDHDFEDILVKENALELLEKELSSKRKRCMVSFGAMSDPYLHHEKKLLYTRRALEIINKYKRGVSIQTKSDLILRDLDLLKEINTHSKCIVNITLTTYDEDLCKILEPNVCSSKRRYEVLKILDENNIKTIVWLDPFLPFINDNKENIIGLLDYIVKSHVFGVICFNIGLTLREGNREYYYEKLDKYFKDLKNKYIKKYAYSYEVVSDNNAYLLNLIKEICQKNNIIYDIDYLFKYMHEYKSMDSTQLTLF